MNPGTNARTVDRTLGERQRTKHFFNRVAPAFHFIDQRLGPQYRRTLQFLAWPENWTVLDIGTGTGTLAAEFVKRGHSVTGIDFADKLLHKARRRVSSARFLSMDVVELHAIPSDSFDAVCLAYVLHGLSPEMRLITLHHAKRIARGGLLIFDYTSKGPWYVRLIEWIEGPNYPSFVACGITDHIAPYRLVVKQLGRTSPIGGWWWCVPEGSCEQ